MSLIRLLFRSHRAFIALALLLSLSSAAIGVAMIAYVARLLAQVGDARGWPASPRCWWACSRSAAPRNWRCPRSATRWSTGCAKPW